MGRLLLAAALLAHRAGRSRAYPALLEWWVEAKTKLRRHLWPGNFTSRAGGSGSGSFAVSELMEQIHVTRVHPGASGNVHFSMRSFTSNQAGMNDALIDGPYRVPALVPHSPWMKAPPPPAPRVSLGRDSVGVRTVELTTSTGDRPWLWVVRTRYDSGWHVDVVPGAAVAWRAPTTTDPLEVVVTTVNRIGEERAR